MRNKIEKLNKTKFDYCARFLGFIGIIIIAVTFVFGSHTLLTISNENNALTQMVDSPNSKEHINRSYDQSEEVIIIEEE